MRLSKKSQKVSITKCNQKIHHNIPKKINSIKKTLLTALTIVKNNNSNNMSKNRKTEVNPKKNQPNIRNQENQSHHQVYSSLHRLWRSIIAGQTLAMGLSYNWRSFSLWKRRPFGNSFGSFYHHFWRTLLYWQKLRLHLSQRYLCFGCQRE